MNKPIPLKISLKNRAGRIFDKFATPPEEQDSIRAIVYHKITDEHIAGEWLQMTTPVEIFDIQMKCLKDSGYRTVSARDVSGILRSEAKIPPRTVSITFDDGYKDNFRNAFPVLRKYGFAGTIFITAKFINETEHGNPDYLNWDEITEMRRSGVFTFECHSLSHKNLALLNKSELVNEIKGAKDILEDRLNESISTFAYPYGWQNSFNQKVIDAVKEAGFLSSFTGIYGENTKHTDPFRLKRLRVSWLDDPEEFQMIMRGAYDWYSLYQRMVSLWKKPQSI